MINVLYKLAHLSKKIGKNNMYGYLQNTITNTCNADAKLKVI
jgi:hypothetical protein